MKVFCVVTSNANLRKIMEDMLIQGWTRSGKCHSNLVVTFFIMLLKNSQINNLWQSYQISGQSSYMSFQIVISM